MTQILSNLGPQNVGWKCPACGAGLAPAVQRCDHGVATTAAPTPPVAPGWIPGVPTTTGVVTQFPPGTTWSPTLADIPH